MKKIINIYNGYLDSEGQGGGIRYLQDLIAEQNKQGYQVVVLGSGKGERNKRLIDGVSVEYVPIADTLNWVVFMLYLFVHILRNRSNYSNSLFHIHRVYFSPVIWFVKGVKVVATIHTKTFSVFESKYPHLKFLVKYFITIERLLISRFVDSLSASGPYAKQLYLERHPGVCDNMLLLPGRCTLTPTDEIDIVFKNDDRKIILCVGRIAHVKRPISVVELFLSAIKKDPNIANEFALVFVGDGECKNELNQIIDSSSLKNNVRILGSVSSNRMPAIYNSSHSMILLSESETGPYVVKEALLSGKPVFSTNVGIVSRCVSSGSGCVIPLESPELRVDEFIEFLQTEYSPHDCRKDAVALLSEEERVYQMNLNTLYQNRKNN